MPAARTIHEWRRALLGQPVGRMPGYLETLSDCPVKVGRKGANTYDLPKHPAVWQLARALILEALAIRRRFQRQPSSSRHSANTHKRAAGALSWAIGSVDLGRNNVGYRLVLLLRRIGLGRDEVEDVLQGYQREVHAVRPGPPYTWSEAMNTLRSAFKRP